MLRKISLLFMMFSLVFSISQTSACAQDADEFWEFTFGKVVRISRNQVTILEYNFDKDIETEEVYDVSDVTEFVNIKALSNLRIGDEIEIEFKEENKKRIVMAILKDESPALDEGELQELMEETENQIEG